MLKKAAISFMSWVVFGRATTPLWLKWWCTVSWNCWRVTVMLSELWKDIIWHFKERRWYICSGPFRIKEGRRRGWEALKSCYYLVWSRWGGKKKEHSDSPNAVFVQLQRSCPNTCFNILADFLATPSESCIKLILDILIQQGSWKRNWVLSLQ